MADFNDDTKKEISNNYFSEGVHKVTISGVILDKTQEGKEFFEFGLEGENGEEGTARIWWTEKAAPYSFNTVRQIFVHNTKEANRAAVRAKVDATKNTDELFKLCQDNLEGKEAWFKVEKTGGTYLNNNGEVKDSYNRNIYGYEPNPPKQTPESLLSEISNAKPIDDTEIPFN